MNVTQRFGIRGENSIIAPENLGLVNGKLALNGWYPDVAEIRGLFAPPHFSGDFLLKVRFDGHPAAAGSYTWEPDMLTRRGRAGKWQLTSRLLPAADRSGAIMRIEAVNRSGHDATLEVQFELVGMLGTQKHWGFSHPREGTKFTVQSYEDGHFILNGDGAQIRFGSSLPLRPRKPWCAGVIDTPAMKCGPGEKLVFHLALAIGEPATAAAVLRELLADPERSIRDARAHWRRRVRGLFRRLPDFTADNAAYVKLYHRSLMHLLLNEWNVPDFLLHPYYGTGSINGGCVGCYLWNYGEIYRLWSMLDPKAARAHLETYLKLDLSECFAFFPDDGSAFGPYYPINQEKVLLLTYAYVVQTGDVAYLHHKVDGKRIIDHMIEQAMMHDDLSKPAVLVDFGNGNHHLELRRELRYDGIVPDLNLRRCVNYRIADRLCKLAEVAPPCDMVARANALRDLVIRELWSDKDRWFFGVDATGKYLRYTMQMFKVLGWGDWALTPEIEAALTRRLMDENEFLGPYGIHSLAKIDPAYDERDVDNGGPGACPSFAPAIADRLYQRGDTADGDEILRRLLWLGEDLPYWGDSHRADVRDYRRDTPLQCDIQGCGPAQTMIFGLFGLRPTPELTVEIAPHLPKDIRRMALTGVRMQGKVFDVICEAENFKVLCGGRTLQAKYGETITL